MVPVLQVEGNSRANRVYSESESPKVATRFRVASLEASTRGLSEDSGEIPPRPWMVQLYRNSTHAAEASVVAYTCLPARADLTQRVQASAQPSPMIQIAHDKY